MKRKVQIKGYTRTVNGKTVKVKAYSRTAGKDGVSSAGAGSEFAQRRAEKASATEAPTVYNEDPNAMTPVGLTREEFDRQAMLQYALRTYKAAPDWQKKKLMDDPQMGPILKSHFESQGRGGAPAQPKQRRKFKLAGKLREKVAKKNQEFSTYSGLPGKLNRLADRINAFADRKIAESKARKK